MAGEYTGINSDAASRGTIGFGSVGAATDNSIVNSDSGAFAWDATHAPYQPTTMVYHGMSIAVKAPGGNAIEIGRVQSWNPQGMTRQVVHKREISKTDFGRPVDIIPGVADGYTISMSRVEVWNNELEIVLGYKDPWRDLMDQQWPVDFYEFLYKGNSLYRCWVYPNAWCQSYNRQDISADGDGIISVTADFAHMPKLLLPGVTPPAFQPRTSPLTAVSG